MENIDELAQSILGERQRKKRRKKLLELINMILHGQIDSSEPLLDDLFKLYTGERSHVSGPRREYISPADRSGYNYGYMDISEMHAGTPNVE